MNICYPLKSRFSTEATDYGFKHEKVARDILTEYLSNIHENISVGDSGLFRSEVYPYLGASPDGILECSCCETIFVIEIKCPIKATKMPLTELAISDESFCMEYVNGEYILKTDDAYYYQVQLQMFLHKQKHVTFLFIQEKLLCARLFFLMKYFWPKKYLLQKFICLRNFTRTFRKVVFQNLYGTTKN